MFADKSTDSLPPEEEIQSMFAGKSTDSPSPKEEIQSQIADLNLEDLKALRDWLKIVIKQRKAEESLKALAAKKGREVVETRVAGKTTFQLEKVKCGKKKCKCSEGKLHGPYWYAYSWNGKKLTSHYIGKELKTSEENGADAKFNASEALKN